MTEYRANLRFENFGDVDRIARQAKRRHRSALDGPVRNNNANAAWAAAAISAYTKAIGRDIVETAISDDIQPHQVDVS